MNGQKEVSLLFLQIVVVTWLLGYLMLTFLLACSCVVPPPPADPDKKQPATTTPGKGKDAPATEKGGGPSAPIRAKNTSRDLSFSSEENEEIDDASTHDEEEDEAEEIDDDNVNEAAEELELLSTSSSNRDEMKYLVNNWSDVAGRQHLTVDFLVVGMPQADFTPRVTRNGMSLELEYIVPEFFFSPNRLTTASSGLVTLSHAKYAGFVEAVHRFKAVNGYDEPCKMVQTVRLPYKVEQDFFGSEENPSGFELVGMPHWNRDLRIARQNWFVFTVELILVVKPRMIRKPRVRDLAFCFLASPGSDDSNDADDASFVSASL